MSSMKHSCGKRYTQVKRMGKFVGLFCSECCVFPKPDKDVKWNLRSALKYREMERGIVDA